MVPGRKRSRGKAGLQPGRSSTMIRQLYAVFIQTGWPGGENRYRAVLS
jgi:hypothetical protein